MSKKKTYPRYHIAIRHLRVKLTLIPYRTSITHANEVKLIT